MASEDVEITHDTARDDSVCGVFCDEEPDVSFEAFGYTFHRCQSCYEEPCSRCGEEIEDDSNKPKGWCQSCREEIRLICGGDEERGIEKDEDSEQTTLITDGGRAEYDRGAHRDDALWPVAILGLVLALVAVTSLLAMLTLGWWP